MYFVLCCVVSPWCVQCRLHRVLNGIDVEEGSVLSLPRLLKLWLVCAQVLHTYYIAAADIVCLVARLWGVLLKFVC